MESTSKSFEVAIAGKEILSVRWDSISTKEDNPPEAKTLRILVLYKGLMEQLRYKLEVEDNATEVTLDGTRILLRLGTFKDDVRTIHRQLATKLPVDTDLIIWDSHSTGHEDVFLDGYGLTFGTDLGPLSKLTFVFQSPSPGTWAGLGLLLSKLNTRFDEFKGYHRKGYVRDWEKA